MLGARERNKIFLAVGFDFVQVLKHLKSLRLSSMNSPVLPLAGRPKYDVLHINVDPRDVSRHLFGTPPYPELCLFVPICSSHPRCYKA